MLVIVAAVASLRNGTTFVFAPSAHDRAPDLGLENRAGCELFAADDIGGLAVHSGLQGERAPRDGRGAVL